MREAGPRITDADTAKNLFRLRIGGGEREVMSVAYLDNQHRVIEIKDEALGTVSRASVYPREIAKSALLLNASAVILSHNHPSGSLVPSQADRTLTTAIKDCLFMFDIQVLDHIIVTHEGSFSFASNNLI
jgi:DNA repair protein RadC